MARAIPALGRAYPHEGVTTLSWVITAYATLFAALLAPSGRIADVIGRRTLFARESLQRFIEEHERRMGHRSN